MTLLLRASARVPLPFRLLVLCVGFLLTHKRVLRLITWEEKTAFEKTLREAVDEGLLILGESGREIVYFRLKHFTPSTAVIYHPT